MVLGIAQGQGGGKDSSENQPAPPFGDARLNRSNEKDPPPGWIWDTSLDVFLSASSTAIYRRSAQAFCCLAMHVLVTGMVARKKSSVVRLLLLLFSSWARAGAAAAGLNIALHAQSNYAMHGWVAGWLCIHGGL